VLCSGLTPRMVHKHGVLFINPSHSHYSDDMSGHGASTVVSQDLGHVCLITRNSCHEGDPEVAVDTLFHSSKPDPEVE